jgi:uridine kinase
MVVTTFSALAEYLWTYPRKQSTLLIGIDGQGGSGKSSFARALARSWGAAGLPASLVQMDDFYLSQAELAPSPDPGEAIGTAFDWQRLCKEVLCPLSCDRAARYQRYDWSTDRLAEWRAVPVGAVAIVEGIYVLRRELREFYDYRIWVDCPYDLRLARGVERDGERWRQKWEEDWMPKEDAYIAAHHPRQAAHIAVNGSGVTLYDREREFLFEPIVGGFQQPDE